MIWSYGVTCVSERFGDLLPRTLASLERAGFPQPRLFVDGCKESDVPESLRKYELTCRWPKIRTHGNWILSIYELYIRKPTAERFALFQDDFVTYPNLREYLERVPYPQNGYCNGLNFPENTKPQRGWYLSNQRGLGAVCLIFDNETVRLLLASEHMVKRPQDPNRGHKAVDGGIVTAMKKAGRKEYVHNPSLVQHTGERSTMGNRRHPKAPSWRGEGFDALLLLQPEENTAPQPVRRSGRGGRIGLVGYHTASGLGELNRQIAQHMEVDLWLVKPHDHWPMLEPPETTDIMVCPTGTKLDEFLKTVDIVLFAEKPPYANLLGKCEELGKTAYAVPMHEWVPSAARGWAREVNQLLCPTAYSYRQFKDNVPCALFPWPCDTERFQFRIRRTCERFVYIHGHDGVQDRKGASVIRKLLGLWPDIPLTVYDQEKGDWGAAEVVQGVADNRQLYERGDVLLVPHAVDGIGLECLEAAACGMPMLVTDGRPWNEYPALDRIRAASSRRVFQRPVEYFSADAPHLAKLCRRYLGQDVSRASTNARAWAQGRSWKHCGSVLTAFVRGEILTQEALTAALQVRRAEPVESPAEVPAAVGIG